MAIRTRPPEEPMNPTSRLRRRPAVTPFLAALVLLPVVAGCGSQRITFLYPDERADMALVGTRTPALYIDTVTDLRPAEQRQGQGHFFHITFPKDDAWEAPATRIYADALVQDLEQTGLVELVPLPSQADYLLSADLLSFGCELRRTAMSYLLTGLIGGAAGYALGDDASHRAKLALAVGAAGMMAIPVPTDHRAEAEVRLTLRDRNGDIVWQRACLGEVADRSYITPTARQDQDLVTRNLTRATKRANACLFGQLRQFLQEQSTGAASGS
jgi:hypothetical protein